MWNVHVCVKLVKTRRLNDRRERKNDIFVRCLFQKTQNPGELLYACENMHETQLNTAH